jgi:hypothetical protein
MRKEENLLPTSTRRKWLDLMELRDQRKTEMLKEAAAKVDARKMEGAWRRSDRITHELEETATHASMLKAIPKDRANPELELSRSSRI